MLLFKTNPKLFKLINNPFSGFIFTLITIGNFVIKTLEKGTF
jgi:hypothetical protein